jgi:hypothetical protein
MSVVPPPDALKAGTYKKGDVIGLGKTANWYYPYCVITADTFVCVGSTYDGVLYLNVPTAAQAEFFYPQWHQAVDYTSPANKPWVPWKVGYNGLYYEPSSWLTSNHVGKSPVEAEAGVGSRINKDFQYYKDDKENDVCTNQSHPIRAWILLGSLEDDPEINTAGNPYGGEDARIFSPRSFTQQTRDPRKAGGDADGSYTETYYPQINAPVFIVQDTKNRPSSPYIDPSSTYVKIFDTQEDGSNPEPTSWDVYSGKMATKDIMSTSGYMLNYGGYFWFYQGISINLWQQKLIQRSARTKQTGPNQPAGTYTNYLQLTDHKVTNTPMPAEETMIVCENPGPGFQYSAGDFPSVSGRAQPYVPGTSGSGSYSEGGAFDLYMTTWHPLYFTRPVEFFEYSSTFTTTKGKFPTGGTYNGQPSYAWYETSRNYSYTYTPKELKPSYDQLSRGIYSTDKQNKYYYENKSHIVGTLSWSIQGSYSESGSKTTQKNSQYGTDYFGAVAQWKPD